MDILKQKNLLLSFQIDVQLLLSYSFLLTVEVKAMVDVLQLRLGYHAVDVGVRFQVQDVNETKHVQLWVQTRTIITV